jgi:hypothetical protein
MPISASFLLASSRRFATWTSSVISVLSVLIVSCSASPGPAPSRWLAIFYRSGAHARVDGQVGASSGSAQRRSSNVRASGTVPA